MFSNNDVDKVPYFGLWADETASTKLTGDALSCLRAAVLSCAERDVFTDELRPALRYLESHMLRPALCAQFRSALTIRDPLQRYQAAKAAYEAVVRGITA